MYKLAFSVVITPIPAETAHRLAFAAIRAAAATPVVSGWERRLLARPDPVLAVHAFGLDFPSPLGLAAGFDKDARGVDALAALGFGHVEVGTVTAQPQPGNPQPRLFRLPRDRAVVNRMGFNNSGAEVVAQRLRDRRQRQEDATAARTSPPTAGSVVVGVNIGKTKVVPEDGAVADYVASTRALADLADYLVVNVSSPNTPGLRDLQTTDRLRPLLHAVRDTLDAHAPSRVPLLVKIAPDLAAADVDGVADLAVELGLDGIVATNTTIGRDGLRSSRRAVDAAGAGGLSGAPLKARSVQVLRRLRARVGDRLTLVSVGGIESAYDAWVRIRAGATLVQAYTGFVYGGPLWPRRLQRGLAGYVRAAGYSSVADAVGTGG